MDTTQLSDGAAKLILAPDDISKAVQYWLNEKVLKFPCEVTQIERETGQYKSGTFTVFLKEEVIGTTT